MINITNWAYYPNPKYTHDESMDVLLNKDDLTIRLVLWKNFPDHERSVKKDFTEMNILGTGSISPHLKKNYYRQYKDAKNMLNP